MERETRSTTTNQIDGEIAGHSIQAGIIQGGVHFHGSSSPVAPPSVTSVASWEALPELAAELRSLVQAQVHAAHQLPYRLPGARRPSLAAVYVRQDLSSGVEEPRLEAPRPTPILDGNGHLVEVSRAPALRVAVRPPTLTVREVLNRDENLVIAGSAGQGKSTLLLRLAADVAARWCGEQADEVLAEPVIPLRLTARELASRLDLPFAQALVDSAHAEYGALLSIKLRAQLMTERAAGCRWLLLVDALDEVADAADRNRLVDVLAAWASRSGSPYRVIVTTRPIDGAALAPLQRIKAARYELQPFDEQALRRFAENWFAEEGTEHAQRFVRQVRAAHLDELVRVPLLATIAAIIFQQQHDRSLPDNQYELFETYLTFLGSARKATSPFEKHRTALLEHLGHIRVETDIPLIDAAQEWLRQTADHALAQMREDLIDFLVSIGPLVMRNDDLGFLHHSFAEHLAATAQARVVPSPFAAENDEFTQLLYAARPAERGEYARAVLLHYTRLHPAQADPLIRRLHASNGEQHLLAARLLARRVPASRSVVDSFLDTVRKWAMTTQYPGEEILAQASRATHHPGLASWLADLMRDQHIPWPSRTEAATALATRLRGTHAREAVTLLSDLVDDPNASVTHRLAAAEALADSSPEDRAAAQRGLREVLVNSLASGLQCRTAAVILAGFGTEARRLAVSALSAMIDSAETPTQDLVNAATGLVEIGPDHYEVGAEVFRRVLRDPVTSSVGWRDSALGLMSLGLKHSTQAVALVNTLISDRRLNWNDRAYAAQILAELGPQHRTAAVDRIESIFREPDVIKFGRWEGARAIAGLAPDYRNIAVPRLRAALADSRTAATYATLYAKALAEVAPELADEAADELRKIVESEVSKTHRVESLKAMVELGEPHRHNALQQLQKIIHDPAQDTGTRAHAAEALTQAGPDFHPEARETLLRIATTCDDVRTASYAWRNYFRLSIDMQADIISRFLDDMMPDNTNLIMLLSNVSALATSDADTERIASMLLGLMNDEAQSLHGRLSAAVTTARLGRRFHKPVVNWTCNLIRTADLPGFDFVHLATFYTSMSRGLRLKLAHALHDALLSPNSSAARHWNICRALDSLGFGTGPEISQALEDITSDGSAAPTLRQLATIMSTTIGLGHPATTADSDPPFDGNPDEIYWAMSVAPLPVLRSTGAQRLNALASNADVHHTVRREAASGLTAFDSTEYIDSVTELRRQADDKFLNPSQRGSSFYALAERIPDIIESARLYLMSVLDDDSTAVSARVEAIEQLMNLDRRFMATGCALLHRLARDHRASPRERLIATNQLLTSRQMETSEFADLAMANLRLSPVSAITRQTIVELLPRQARTLMERDLLTDRALPVLERIPRADFGSLFPLAGEADRAVRDVLAAPEYPASERIDAATALARLSLRSAPDAARALRNFSQDHPAWRRARRALAGLSREHCNEALAEALAILGDASRHAGERRKAAYLISDLTFTLPDIVVALLRADADGRSSSDRNRVDALFALRWLDGLAPVRAVRDDAGARPIARVKAAVLLMGYDVEDRAVGARVLNTLATDLTVRPALRRQAAEELALLGKAGGELAVTALWSIMQDVTASASTRAAVAWTLVPLVPAERSAVLKTLRDLAATDNPLYRRQALRALGEADPTAAALDLGLMMCDEPSPVVRVRCAEAFVELRHDWREQAAKAVRAVAHDNSAPVHVRRRAARNLARWSDLCRSEAQELLIAFSVGINTETTRRNR
ncbi:NACHT domain-containing protein [Actinosynnema sp. CA-299493]